MSRTGYLCNLFFIDLRYLLLIFSLLIGIGVDAQTLKGTVVDASSKKPLYPVVIVNIRTQQSVYTDNDGNYSIPAQAEDKIAVSYIGYKTMQWTMTSSLGVVEHDFQMNVLSYQLKDYVVRPGHYTPYQLDSLDRHSTYNRALSRVHGGSVMSPVTFVAEKLSRRSKEIFRFQKEFNHWEDQKFIDTRYTPELVSALTNLTGDTLAYFMNAYPMPYDYARTSTELELKMWIRTNFKEWMRKHPDSATQRTASIQEK